MRIFYLFLVLFLLTLSSITDSVNVTTTSDPNNAIQNGNGTINGNNALGGNYCPEISWDGIDFKKTRACSQAIVKCPYPDETTGYATYLCECYTATWSQRADTSNCRHKWLNTIEEGVVRAEDSLKLVDALQTNLKDTVVRRTLVGGDIIGSVDISARLVQLAHIQISTTTDQNVKTTIAKNFTKLLGNTGDQLLSDTVQPTWEQLNSTLRLTKASSLMLALEQSLVLLSDNANQGKVALDFTNWASQVQIKVSQPKPVIATTAFSPKRTMMADSPPNMTPSTMIPTKQTVDFTSYSKSPVMELPSFDYLESITQPVSAPISAMDSPMTRKFFASSSEPASNLKVGYFLYTSVGALLSPDPSSIVNSHVIGAFVDDPTRSISLPESNPATFQFYHLYQQGVANPRCVFWDQAETSWSQRGCNLSYTDGVYTNCTCNHLTSFAILMDITGSLDGLTGANWIALDIITIIGCALSIICLILSVFVFTFFSSLYNARNTIHRNLCLTLLIAELIFVIGIDRVQNQGACKAIAILLHYFFMSAFCWMLLEGYQLYRMLIQVFEANQSKILLYYLVGYGFPAVIVAISAGSAHQCYGTTNYCWIDVKTPLIWAFVAPITVIIVINLIILIIALRVVLSVKTRDRTTQDKIFGWLKGSTLLLCLLGITWIFGYLTAVPTGVPVFAYIFTILNVLQGVMIFVLHVVLNEKVRNVLIRSIRKGVCCIPDPTSSYSSRAMFLSSRNRPFWKFWKTRDSQGSQHSTESTETKQRRSSGSPMVVKAEDLEKKLAPSTPSSPELTSFKEWKSKMRANHHEDEINVRSDDEKSVPSTPKPDRPEPMTQLESLVHEDSIPDRYHPVHRKKFPLGSTDKERSAEARGSIVIERL
uniref:Latrophilin-3 n=1 Tax=Acrobeloides nanus TaxID=290746 RepID=A0A914E9N3_9BILA